jgi:hypothetical protein
VLPVASLLNATGKVSEPSAWRNLILLLLDQRDSSEYFDLARLISLLPTRFHRKPSVDLGSDTANVRDAWVAEVARTVAAIPGMPAALLELALWLVPEGRGDLAMRLAAAVCGGLPDGERSVLEALADHPSDLLMVRRITLRGILDGKSGSAETPGPTDLLGATARLIATAADDISPMTWIGDRNVEQLIEREMSRVAEAFVGSYEGHCRKDEEHLTTTIIERLRAALEKVRQTVDLVGRDDGSANRISFTLSDRVVSKREEGQDVLVKGHAFATDMCLVMTARRDGRRIAHRAIFLQAKKLSMTNDRAWKRDFAIDRSQLEALISNTAASFYLFIGPALGNRTLPVMPAQLVSEMLQGVANTRRLHRDDVSRAGRSLARWLTYDVIGLWTGDKDV